MITVVAYTDGACSGNPGPGGWGVVMLAMQDGKVLKRVERFGGHSESTNNAMEVRAAIEALKMLTRPTSIIVHSDSKYVITGITEWIKNWKQNDWKTAANKPVQNRHLWMQLDDLNQKHAVTWKWVRGHNGNVENERADKLACKGRDRAAKVST